MKKQTIHLYGDSISRGYGLGEFADTVTPSHPLFLLRSIASMANAILYDSGHKDTVVYRGSLYGHPTVESEIREAIRTGAIRSGDTIVLEDAGDTNMDPDDYQAKFEGYRAAVADKHDITVVLMSMFDYPPAPVDHQFDALFGTRTMNDAIRAATDAPLALIGQTIYTDMNAVMDYESMEGPYRTGNYAIPFMHPDGIHPNVWGQLLMTGEILKAAGYSGALSSAASIQTVVAGNLNLAGYGSPYFSAGIAQAMVNHMVIR